MILLCMVLLYVLLLIHLYTVLKAGVIKMFSHSLVHLRGRKFIERFMFLFCVAVSTFASLGLGVTWFNIYEVCEEIMKFKFR